MTTTLELATSGAELRLDATLGIIEHLAFAYGDRQIAPLHRAPWLDEDDAQADAALHAVERRLSGDFLCAPFGTGSDGVPLHGWPCNSAWRVDALTRDAEGARATLTLERDVQGATVEKVLYLPAAAPMLYQTHRVTGGAGGLSLAHHPMFAMTGRGWLSFSPKRAAITPAQPLEPGRGWLSYPAETADLSAFPGAGGPVDLHLYPQTRGHEDFITLVEAAGQRLGWTALIREAEDDLVFVLKDTAVLPVTMLWYSNGGRDYAPWNGRHRGVIGIEDGCASGAGGIAEARAPNAVGAHGVPTVLPLGPGITHVIRHVIGAVQRPAGWQRIADIHAQGDSLRITEAGGFTISLPFDSGFLAPV